MTEASLRTRAGAELRLYAAVSLYLYVCFGTLVVYESALQQTQGGALLPHGVAVVKALVIGKFLLIGRALGDRVNTRAATGLQYIVQRSLLLLGAVLLLSIAEELIVGAAHGRQLSNTVADLLQRPGSLVLAKCLLVTVIILPLVALEQLDEALGHGTLRKALLGPRRPPTEQTAGGGGA